VTPASSIGKTVSGIFALLGIVCVTFLTANIIDMNSQYEKKDSIETSEDKINNS
jgi:hypothetical protein